MFLGLGRSVRIPLPPLRAGFRKARSWYHRKGGDAVRLDVKALPRATAIRRDLRTRARLYRSPLRWVILFVVWGGIGGLFLVNPLSRISFLHFALMLSAVAAWFATFHLLPVVRIVGSVALLAFSALCLALGQPQLLVLLVGVGGVSLAGAAMAR